MNDTRVLHTVAIYLKGDDLVPEELNARIGTEADESHRRGDNYISANGKEITRRTGLWKLTRTEKSALDLPRLLKQLTSELSAKNASLSDLPGVEEAFVDVFIAQTADAGGGGTSEFEIDSSSIAELGKLGLPIRFTVAIIRD